MRVLPSWGSILGVTAVILERMVVGNPAQGLHSDPHPPTTSPYISPFPSEGEFPMACASNSKNGAVGDSWGSL